MILAVCLFYVVLDGMNGITVFFPWYTLMMVLGGAALWLNRRRQYLGSTIIILGLLSTMVFLFADADHPHGGVYFFFVPVSLGILILLSYYRLRWTLLLALIPIALAYAAYLFDTGILPAPSQNPSMITINFLANFTAGILTCILIVQFLIEQNRESEQSLLDIQKTITKTSDELASSEERFAMALKGTRAGIYEWNVLQNRVYVSDYYRELLGLNHEPGEYRLEDFIERVHPEDRDRIRQSMMFHLNTQMPYQEEVRICVKGGSYRWFLNSGIGKADEGGILHRVVGSIIDIEERKQGEQKILQQNDLLAKANRELDYFVYSVSHDLRAPLSSILGLTNVYAITRSDNEKASLIAMINERAHALDEFIREVLDYSRNARVEVKAQDVNVLETVNEVIRGLQHMTGIEEVSIELGINQDQHIVSDRERLKVILSNLISNAINYRDKGKKCFIRIASHLHDGYWSLTIQDNGIGIRKEHQPRIFEMFYKAHDRGQGTGLGLYIVKETLQKLGGEIQVTSRYGEGSTFSVFMPSGRQEPNLSEEVYATNSENRTSG